MATLRSGNDGLRRLTRLARRGPWRPVGLALVGVSALASLVGLVTVATSTAFLGLAALLLDRFVWRHTRTAGLRARYRQLGIRVEALDERMAAIRRSEDVHRSLTQTFGDVAVEIDASGTVRFANSGFRQLFGAVGTLPIAFEGDEAEGEDAFGTSDGKRVLRWRATAVLDASGNPATRWIARDVTDAVNAREAAERAAFEAERRAAARSRFLAVAAHEIRNPLSGISGMAELLAMGALDAHARSQVAAITRSAAALQAVLDDLLDDARMEADRLEVEHEPFDLGAVLEGVCELAVPDAHDKSLDLATHTVRHGPQAVPRTVEGDANRVRQIVANLVGNAIKFTVEGHIQVLAKVDETGLTIAVRDTGPGLTADEAARVFDVFESGGDEAESARLARRLGGVGLGLTISRRLAQAMGGTLDVVSQPGEGSTFTLTLPCETVERPEATTLEGIDVRLVTDAPGLAAPLRRFVEERGGRLVVSRSEGYARERNRGARWSGPLLIDEHALIGDLPENAVLLVRDAAARAPAARWLRLPWRASSLERALTDGDAVDAMEPSVLRAAIDTGGAGARVLVAEDDPVTQLLATAVLERAGHRVTLAATGHDAARLYREAAEGDAPFETVLLDVNLTVSGETGMDGMSALTGIRAIEKARGIDPVALHVVTGDVREETRDAAMEAGATGVWLKPVPVEVLVGLVARERLAA